MKKVLLLCITGTIAFAMDYEKLDRELAIQKQENVLRELRIERKTGKLREKSVDRDLKRAEILDKAAISEAYKNLITAKSLPVKSNGYVGKVLLTDGIALHSGMETPYGKVRVEEMRVGSFWIDAGSFGRTQASIQSPQLPQASSQMGTSAVLTAPPPPPPPPPVQQGDASAPTRATQQSSVVQPPQTATPRIPTPPPVQR